MTEKQVYAIVDLALEEDLSRGDITSNILVPPDIGGRASILIKDSGIFVGGEVANVVFQRVDPSLQLDLLLKDGTKVKPGDIVGWISGKVISILKAERVALNFMQRLSGIASLTAQYVNEIQGMKAGIYDTRKTTPGLRFLEKYAVRMGGGRNHRFDLSDAVLIKDNHIAISRARGLTLTDVVKKAKSEAPKGMIVEVEVNSLEDTVEAAKAGADIIMFDNMSPELMRQGVGLLPAGIKTEASGNINLGNVRTAALSGVDIISIGALTHSAKRLDISLELEMDFFPVNG
jgi:nicotinate-nucleotide pyrophosphorylase (carboxylating)